MKKALRERIEEIRETSVVLKRLLGILWDVDKKLFLGSLIAVSIPAIIPFINAYIYKLIIDLIVEAVKGAHFNYSYLYTLVGLRFATLIIQNVAFSFQGYIDLLMWTTIPVYLYQMILSKLAALDVEYFETSSFRDVLQRVKESYTWRPLNMFSSFFYTFQSILQLLIALIALATLNLALIFAITLIAIPAFVTQIYYAKTIWGVWAYHSPYRKRFWYLSELVQDAQGIKETKLFQTSKRFLDELSSMQRKFAKDSLNLGKKRLRISLLLDIFGVIIYLGVEVFIILLTVAQKITLGSLSYFSFVLLNFQTGINGFFSNITQLYSHSLYVKDIIQVLDAEPKIKIVSKPTKLNLSRPPKIEFRDVTFSYPGEKIKALNNFNLIINPGEKIAFVGENGAGKTTVIKLLARFYDVNQGEILINGVNIKNIDLLYWYKVLGVIFQDFIRYEYSLRDNIHFGKIYKPLDFSELEKAAKLSGVDKIAKGFASGYEQVLGTTFEGGVDLSIGQWQKVALARAFLRDAPVLILDEPTSSLDAKAEKEIFDKVDKLERDKTVITISHRFSTVKNADRVFVIDKGKIIESGSHKELIKNGGIYSKLFKIQAERYLEN